LQEHAALRPIRTRADFERMHALADRLADEVGDNEAHPLFSLFEIAMDLIERWESENVSLPAGAPRELLRFLLDEHRLKQKDLADIASPGLISDILAGRREISKNLAKDLARRFNVSASAFL
jgi:HTH-type transcriptional regulator/antitoxin HigA